MIEKIVVTVLPAAFLSLLYGGEALARLRGGFTPSDPPIGRALFACCKFAISIPWSIMVLRAWGVEILAAAARPAILRGPALVLWGLGFALLFAGRLGLGAAFRVGLARDETGLKVGGVFRLSRNPMYLGIDATLAAAALYTLDALAIAAGVFIAAAHHRIILAEEARLGSVFGEGYSAYRRAVRRYL